MTDETVEAATEQPAIFEPSDPAARERALAEAEADAVAGRVIPAVEVFRWLRSLGTDNELPPPEPWK